MVPLHSYWWLRAWHDTDGGVTTTPGYPCFWTCLCLCTAGASPRIFDWGRDGFRLGDGFRWMKTTYPQIPISPRISATLFWKYRKIWKFWQIIWKFSLKIVISGGISPRNFELRDTSPPSPPVATPMMHCMHYQKPTASITLMGRYC